MELFKIALVGRPNVGKSTLFNALAGGKDALVDGEAGLTRDRIYRQVTSADREWLLIDTGGFAAAPDPMQKIISVQTNQAITEAGLICLVTDAHTGLHPTDQELTERLRRANRPLWLVINKMDGVDERMLCAEYAPLGLSQIFLTSAKRRRGITTLREAMATACPAGKATKKIESIRVAFLGRPNVGKSTLVNCLLDEERMLTTEIPGTTRDSVAAEFSFAGKHFILIDTAGIRRRAKTGRRVEKISTLKALESSAGADVVVLVCDATQPAAYQDVALSARVLANGRALVVALNKCDQLDKNELQAAEEDFAFRMKLSEGIRQCKISALHNQGIRSLLHTVSKTWASAMARVSTAKCNQILRAAITQHAPPRIKGRQSKLRFIHQGGVCPPRFIVHGNHLKQLPQSYQRYLSGFFRRSLALQGTEVILDFREPEE